MLNLISRVPVNEDWATTLHIILPKIPKMIDHKKNNYDIAKTLARWDVVGEKTPSSYHICPYCGLALCDPFEEIRIFVANYMITLMTSQ